jgi:hypothetical protein
MTVDLYKCTGCQFWNGYVCEISSCGVLSKYAKLKSKYYKLLTENKPTDEVDKELNKLIRDNPKIFFQTLLQRKEVIVE